MSEILYEDKCLYCWGDPRLEDKLVQARVILRSDGVKLETKTDSVLWPRKAIRNISYQATHPVDIEDAAGGSVEKAQDIAIGLAMDHLADPAVSLIIHDPESVYEEGFDIRLIFTKEYNARVFAKRVSNAFGVGGNDGLGNPGGTRGKEETPK